MKSGDNQRAIMVLVGILIAILLYRYSPLGSIYSNYEFNKSFQFNSLSFFATSTINFSSIDFPVYLPNCNDAYVHNTYSSQAESDSVIRVSSSCNTYVTDTGCGAGSCSPVKTIAKTTNLNMQDLESLALSIESNGGLAMRWNEGGNKGFAKISLFSEGEEIVLYTAPVLEYFSSRSYNENKVLTIYRHLDYFILDNTGTASIINLDPNKSYQLAIEVESGDLSGFSSNSREINIKSLVLTPRAVSPPPLNNTPPTNTTIYITQVVNNTVNQTIYVEKQVEYEATFFERYGMASIVLILLGGVIIWLILRKK